MKEVTKNAIIYSVGNALNALLPILLLPLLTHTLTPVQYSVISLFQLYIFILSPIIGLESISAVSRFYFDERVNISQYVVAALILSVICGVSGIFTLNIVWQHLNLESKYKIDIILIAILYCILMFAYNLYIALLINKHQALKYTNATLSLFFLNIGLTALFYKYSIINEYLRIGPMMISAAIACGLSYIALSKLNLLREKPDVICLVKMADYSVPLIIHTLSGALLGMGPLVVMSYNGEVVAVGSYSIALTIGSAIGIIGVGINKAITPKLIELFEKKPEIIDIYKKYIGMAAIILIGLIPTYLLMEPCIFEFLSFFVNDRHAGYTSHLKWVVTGFILNTIYLLYVNIIVCYKQTKSLAFYTLLSASLGILGSYVGMKTYGAESAGVGMAIAFTILTTSVYIKSMYYKASNFKPL
jgi:O-antigen/teichoic acid export membrane protein